MRAMAIAIAAACAALACVGAPQPARGADAPDLNGFWSSRFGPRSATARALVAELPEGAVLINDAGGGELALGEFGGLRLSAAATEQARNYSPADELKRENTCRAPSVVFYMQAPFPLEIHQGTELIVFAMEYFDLYRVIFLDGRARPGADVPHTKSGFSVGRFEDGTLVVETTHIAPGTFANNGFDHSADIKLTERFRLSPDGSTLALLQVYEDPKTFAGVGARIMEWSRRPGEHIFPYDCDPTYGRE